MITNKKIILNYFPRSQHQSIIINIRIQISLYAFYKKKSSEEKSNYANHFDKREIESAIMNIKIWMVAGFDEVHPEFIKTLDLRLNIGLSKFYSDILDSKKLPK